ncbi:MAG: hypothetical protein WD423_06800 [Rhodothermales bacterium]
MAWSGVLILVIAAFFALRAARDHVLYVTGGTPASPNCVSCHGYMGRQTLVKHFFEKEYVSPGALAVNPSGTELYVVAEEEEALLVVSTEENRVEGRIPVGRRPYGVALTRDGTMAYVSNGWSDTVSEIDLESRDVVRVLPVGSGPSGLALDRNQRFLYVANMYSDDISVVNLEAGREDHRLPAGNNPYAVALSPDGRQVYVTNRLVRASSHMRDTPETEITVVDTQSGRIADRKALEGAHVVEGVDFTPQGDLALTTLVRPKNLIPSTQLHRGWMLTYGIGVIERSGQQRVLQLLTDDANAYYADPHDVLISPDGRQAYVTHAAARTVSVLNVDAIRRVVEDATEDSLRILPNHLGMSSRFVTARIPTGYNPKGLALSPDGKKLYIAERLDDRILVVDTDRLEPVDSIALGGPDEVTVVRRGAQIFHTARAFQRQFSCRGCHPDGDQDGLSWDFGGDGIGKNVVNTMTLRDIGATAPFKWTGTNTSLYMQDGVRFAKFLTRMAVFPENDLKALVAYVYSIPAPPNRHRRINEKQLTEEQQRGKNIFERAETLTGVPIEPAGRCSTCHSGTYFTNGKKFDVGTRRSADTPGVLFDTPQLVNIYDTAPYLHDGSASTLEQIWTENSVNDEHGVVSDLGKNQLNDLVEYLKTLAPPPTD